jgi:hypothetical protein
MCVLMKVWVVSSTISCHSDISADVDPCTGTAAIKGLINISLYQGSSTRFKLQIDHMYAKQI